MKKKPSIFTKPSTTIACVAFAGLLAAGMFLTGCDHTPDPENLSNVASAAQGTAPDVPETQGIQEQSTQAQTDGSEQPIPEPKKPADEKFEAWQKPSQSVPEQPTGGLQSEEPEICRLPPAPQTKIDINKCKSYTSIPFRVTDANGNELEVEEFPEIWGGGIYCTISPQECFQRKFQDSSKHPDAIADHSRLTVDFGNYVPQEVKVTRDTLTYDLTVNAEINVMQNLTQTDVFCDATSDGKFVFEADFQNANTVYYVISAKWDRSHAVDYAIAVRKA